VGLIPLALLSACASLPEDHGQSDVNTLVADRTAQVLPAADADIRALVSELFSQPLTSRVAVQIALVNNPRLRAEYARLGISAAAVYDAGRVSNPRFGVAVMYPDESSAANQVTFGLAQSFTDLLLLSSRSRLAAAEFERTKLEVGAATVALASDAEAAYFRVVSARHVSELRESVAAAAQVSAALAQRFYAAGNINALELALERSAASEAKLAAMRAEADLVAARNALNRLLGLQPGDQRWVATEPLWAPVASEDSLEELIALAQVSRLDLAARQAQVDLLADSLGVTRRFRYLGESEVGIETERETDRSRITGPSLLIELPIFNTGEGRIAQAEALVDQAEAELRALALDVVNDVQLAHAQVQASRALVEQYRDTFVPLRESVVALTQERVDFMLEGQFQLLLVKQQEFEAYQGYLEALRDYWVARTELARAVGARLPSDTSRPAEPVSPPPMPSTDPPAGEHSHRHGAGGHGTHPPTNHSSGDASMDDHAAHAMTLKGEQQ